MLAGRLVIESDGEPMDGPDDYFIEHLENEENFFEIGSIVE